MQLSNTVNIELRYFIFCLLQFVPRYWTVRRGAKFQSHFVWPVAIAAPSFVLLASECLFSDRCSSSSKTTLNYSTTNEITNVLVIHFQGLFVFRSKRQKTEEQTKRHIADQKSIQGQEENESPRKVWA
jgi:hypothetical protein